MSGPSRQDWWDEEPDGVPDGPGRADGDRGTRQGSWFLALLAATFFALMFSVGLDLVMRLIEDGRVRVPAVWLERIDLALGIGLFLLGASVGIAFGRLGRLGGAKAAACSFLVACLGMGYLLLLQAGLWQARSWDAGAPDLQTWLQGRSLAVYGLAVLGSMLAWFLPFRARCE